MRVRGCSWVDGFSSVLLGGGGGKEEKSHVKKITWSLFCSSRGVHKKIALLVLPCLYPLSVLRT